MSLPLLRLSALYSIKYYLLVLSDECWDKFKAIMLSLGIYDKPSLRQTVEGAFLSLAPSETCLPRLVSGMPCISDSMPGRFKRSPD
jgi:hypothetical protein